jgi:hypothetical protein
MKLFEKLSGYSDVCLMEWGIDLDDRPVAPSHQVKLVDDSIYSR